MRKLLKNEMGNAVVIIILIIPTIIAITFGFSYRKLFETSHEKRIINIVNNSLYYASENYGNVSLDKNGLNYCSFSEVDIFGKKLEENQTVVNSNSFTKTENDCFYNDFYETFTRIDGYHKDRWYFEMAIISNTDKEIEKNKSEFNSYIEITVHIEIPKKYDVDHFGRVTTNEKTGWYLEQEEVYNVLEEHNFSKIDIKKLGSAV